MSNSNLFRTGVAARKLQVSPSTIRSWILKEQIGYTVVAKEKRISQADIFKKKLGRGAVIALYVCVPHQKKADLQTHTTELTKWVEATYPGIAYKVYSELGISSNQQRRKFDTLLKDVENQKVAEVVCLFKDCFFLGDSYFLEHLLERSGVQLVVVHTGRTYATPPEVASAIAKAFSTFIEDADPKKIKNDFRELLQNK